MKEFIIRLGHRRLWKYLASFSRHLTEIHPAKQSRNVIMCTEIRARDNCLFLLQIPRAGAYGFLCGRFRASLFEHPYISKPRFGALVAVNASTF